MQQLKWPRIRSVRLALPVVALTLFGPAPAMAGSGSPLVAAARRADRSMVSALLARNADVNAAEADGSTALHYAVNAGDVETADLLIAAGARVSQANRYGIAPLLIAATNGNAGMIERLLRAGADPNTKNREGETALMLVARTGSVAAVRAMLVRGADVNAVEGWRGQSALMWAATEGHRDAVATLLEGGAERDVKSRSGFNALLFAVRAGHLPVVQTLLEAGARPSDALNDGTSALVLAALNARWDVGLLLLDKGAAADAEGQGWTALHQTALTRSPHHDNVNPQPIPLGAADSLDFVNALLAHGADVNRRTTRTPTDGFRQWIRREGATAFFLAAKAADVPLMRLLVERGADPLIATTAGVTPLAAAAGVGFCQGESPGTEAEALEAVEMILPLGADVNQADDDGYTPMHGAAVRGANHIVQFLYDRAARLDAPSKKDQWTPWTMANGVMLANTYKRQLATADYLKRLLDTRAVAR